jgi:hypothetical protein
VKRVWHTYQHQQEKLHKKQESAKTKTFFDSDEIKTQLLKAALFK